MSHSLLDLLPLSEASTSVAELANTLAQVAAAVRLRDTRPAALTAAALAAAAGAQRAQDEEEAAFEVSTQLAAQIAAARRVVEQLEELTASLDAAAGGLAEEARAHAGAAAAKQAKTSKYKEQQRQLQEKLQAVGCCPELNQVHLQSLGRERTHVLAELHKAQAELERFRGLPADAVEAKAATLEKRHDLERLRARLQEHLIAMQ